MSTATGHLVVTEIAQRPLQQSMLRHDDCYCLDNCGQQVFVWKGKSATKEEKSGSVNNALQYMKAKGYGQTVQLEIVNDGAESALFRSCFSSWKDAFAVSGSKQAPKTSNIAKVEQTKFDARKYFKILTFIASNIYQYQTVHYMQNQHGQRTKEWLTTVVDKSTSFVLKAVHLRQYPRNNEDSSLVGTVTLYSILT